MVTNPDDALALIAALCALPRNAAYKEDTEKQVRSAGITRAVVRRDTPALYAWLMGGFSYQGISDPTLPATGTPTGPRSRQP